MSQAMMEMERDLEQEFESLQTRHQQIYEAVSQTGLGMAENQRDDYLVQANQLVDDIKAFVPYIALVDEYTWVNQAALQWQSVFSSILDDPRDVRHEIQSLAIHKTLLAAVSPKVFSRQDVERQAYYLGQNRKTRELLKNPDLIFQYFPSTPEEQETDWKDACSYLSLDILEGKLDFFSGIQPGLYEALEYAWLEDIKRYKAYFEWKEHGQNQNSDEFYYFQACGRINDRFLDVYSKLPARCFKNIKAYLADRYFTDGSIDLGKVRGLIERKAYHLWDKNQDSDPHKNWLLAEQYVREFYGNIMGAIQEQDARNIDSILKFFQENKSSESFYNLINCFEAAIAIYFVQNPSS